MSLIASTCAPASTMRVRQAQVVVQRVQVLARVRQVARVAQRHLGDGGARRAHRVDRRPHLLDVVERVEDPEDVDAGGRRLADERLASPPSGTACSRPCCGRAAASAWRRSAAPRAGRQPVPRVLAEEPERDVVGRAAPRLDATAAAGSAARRTGPTAARSYVRTRVASSDWWASRNVVSVTARAVCSRRASAKPSGPSSSSRCRLPGGAGAVRSSGGQLLARVEPVGGRAVRPVDGHVAEEREQLGPAVRALLERRAARALLDERGGQVARDELRVGEHLLEERDVGADAADAELGQGAPGAGDGGREVAAAAGELDEHRVEVPADLRAGGRRGAVEPDAGARRASGRRRSGRCRAGTRSRGPRW